MESPEATAARIVATANDCTFSASVWRVHWREVPATDWSLSLRSSGRYHRGTDRFPPSQSWPVLYTSLAPEVAFWEMVRRSAARNMVYLKNSVLSEIAANLDHVLDLTSPTLSGTDTTQLKGSEIEFCQTIAALARSQDYEGLLVPSAELEGTNLVIIPDNISEPSAIRVVRSTDLHIDF